MKKTTGKGIQWEIENSNFKYEKLDIKKFEEAVEHIIKQHNEFKGEELFRPLTPEECEKLLNECWFLLSKEQRRTAFNNVFNT